MISVIMAAYNAEKTIEVAVNSVVNQTYRDWELLVIDDCSSDSTAVLVKAMAEEEPRIHLLHNEINSGVSLTRKRGVDAAMGDWIAVLDSDDAWAPDKLEKQIFLAKETRSNLIFTGSAFMDNDGNPVDWQLHVPPALTFKELLKQNLVSNSSVLVKKDLYKKYYVIGDEMHEDFALWLKITKDGNIAYGIDEPLLIYRLSKSSKSSNKIKAAKMNWHTYRYVGLNPLVASYYMCWYIVKGLLKYRHLN